MISNKQFARLVEELYPLEYQYSWDNSGFNIIDHEGVEKVLTCLDVTREVLMEAHELGCDTVLSHHPVMFHAVKKVDVNDPVTGIVHLAVKLGINVYCSHTACDCAPFGLNRGLAERLKMKVESFFIKESDVHGLGFIGTLEKPMAAEEFATLVKTELGCERVRHSRYEGEICRFCAIGGSAGEFFKDAYNMGAQALIVGDAKYNDFLDAKAMGVMLIEAGHYETEVNFTFDAAKGLQARANELQYKLTFVESGRQCPPYKAI